MHRHVMPGTHCSSPGSRCRHCRLLCWLRWLELTENLLRRLSAGVHSRQSNGKRAPLFRHAERQRAAPPVEIPQDSTHSLPRLCACTLFVGMLPIPNLPVAENVLNRQFVPQGSNQVWGTDISVPQQAA